MKETELEKRERLVRKAKEECDLEWVLAGLMIILIAGFFVI
jgi:hypothetical protein